MRVARVLIVDDHPLFRIGLAAVLSRTPSLEVVGEAGSRDEALACLRATAVDLVLLDVFLPRTSGISFAAELHDEFPALVVLGLSVADDPGVIADFLRAPATGYVLKTQPPDELVEAIFAALAGIRPLPPIPAREAILAELEHARHLPLQRLSPREREVFELLIRGCSNDEIASRLFIARRTVESHRYRITTKLSAHSITQMQRLAARYGELL